MTGGICNTPYLFPPISLSLYPEILQGVPQQAYFAVYDGHGGRGVVDYVEKRAYTERPCSNEMVMFS